MYTTMAASPKISPVIIDKDEVVRLLDLRELMIKIESALGNLSDVKDGGVEQPNRTAVDVSKHHGVLFTMPGYSSADDALATKLVSYFPNNSELPTHQAWVMLFDPSNGSLLAIIDGVSITAVRTGVASAVATKHLAHPNSKILAILGTGTQARGHYEALSLIQHFDEVRIWGRNPAKAQKCAKDIQAAAELNGTTVIVCATTKEACENADVICTVTFSTTPLVNKDWVKAGAHINAVGACRPDRQELDASLMRSAVVYCDSRQQCLCESGDIILSECEIFAEIGDVINGHQEAKWQQTTIFKSVGLAIEDVVSAKLVYDKYMQEKSELASSQFAQLSDSSGGNIVTPFFSSVFKRQSSCVD